MISMFLKNPKTFTQQECYVIDHNHSKESIIVSRLNNLQFEHSQ